MIVVRGCHSRRVVVRSALTHFGMEGLLKSDWLLENDILTASRQMDKLDFWLNSVIPRHEFHRRLHGSF